MADPTPDIKRLQKLYQDTQQKMYNSKGARLNQENRHLLRVVQAENAQLKDSLRYVQIKLAKAKQFGQQMQRKLRQQRDQVKRIQDQLSRQISINHAQVAQIQQMNRQLQQATVSHQQISDKTKKRSSDYQTEIEHLNQDIRRLQNQLLDKNDSIKIMTVGQEQYKAKSQELEDQLEVKCSQITHIRAKLAEGEQRINQLLSSKKSEGSLAVEVQHLRTDNERLLKLLRSTKEYKSFGEFSRDNAGGVRYVGSSAASSRMNNQTEPGSMRTSPSGKVKKSGYNEQEAWIPHEAYRMINDFRNEHGRELTNTMVNKLLAELNNIWRERERKQIARVRNQCNAEVMGLRRQLAMRVPLDQAKNKSEITKLRGALKKAEKENRQNMDEIARLNDAPAGTQAIEKTLKSNNMSYRERKQKDDQLIRLKTKVKSLSNIKDQYIHSNLEQKFTQHEIADFKEVFSFFDKSLDGTINTQDLQHALRSSSLIVCKDDLTKLIKKYDPNFSGKIDFQGYLNCISQVMNKRSQGNDDNEIRQIFSIFDKQGTGLINIRQIKHIMTHFGDTLDDEQMDSFIKQADLYGDGYIRMNDLVSLLLLENKQFAFQN